MSKASVGRSNRSACSQRRGAIDPADSVSATFFLLTRFCLRQSQETREGIQGCSLICWCKILRTFLSVTESLDWSPVTKVQAPSLFDSIAFYNIPPPKQVVVMGVQPQLYLLHVQEQMTKARRSPPFSKYSMRWHRHHEPSEEAQHLKERLLRIHKMKLTHFSLSHIKKVVEPSVHVVVLPEEAQKLKEKILRSHKAKSTRFSLSYMKTVVVPPVAIPKEMNCQRALNTIVAGRNVPLTRCMWDNTKRKVHYLEQIPESYPLDCTLFR